MGTSMLDASKINKKENTSFLLVLLLLMVSGNPILGFIFGWEPVLVIFTIFLVWILIKNNLRLFEKKGLMVFGLFLIISIFQIVYFNYFPLITIIGFLLRLFIGYAVIRLVINFPRLYVLAIYKLCLMSLIFWGLGKTGVFDGIILNFPELQYDRWSRISSHSLGFHTFYLSPENGVLRNAGVFWEPGAFAGYIIVAIIFLSLGRHLYTKETYKKCLVLFAITLLTTMSSAGYILLPLSLFIGYEFKSKKSTHKFKPLVIFLVLISIIFIGSFVAFNNIDFLQEKTSSQLQSTLTMSANDLSYNNTRFGTLMFDWFYIQSSPIFGNGLSEVTRYRYHGEDRIGGQGNGLSDFIAKFGIIGFIGFTYFLYIGLRHCFGRSKKIFLTIFIMFASLSAEPFLNYPLYLGFMFLNCAPKRQKDINK